MIDVPSVLRSRRDAILAMGGDVVVFEIGPPATRAQVESVERVIRRTIPPSLRRVFLAQSATLKLAWVLEHGLPKGLGQELSGGIDLSLAELPIDFENWSGWRAAFESPADYGWPAEWNLDAYHELFPVVAALNGDQIVVADQDEETSDLVLYLNHESDDFKFLVLSETLEDFLSTWCQLGCPGPEWWDLVRFMDSKTERLSLKTRRSAAWLQALSQSGPPDAMKHRGRRSRAGASNPGP